MKPTKLKIIQTAIKLFNQQGVGNVRVQDIAKAAAISPGNLTYHFKTKRALTKAVYLYMQKSLESLTFGDYVFGNLVDGVQITRNYLEFQIQFRFFYRDALEIIRMYPEAQELYKKQVKKIINFNRNIIFLAVEKGQMKAEPHKNLYDSLAKNAWAILNSWLSEREIIGEESININNGLSALLDLYFPYLTKKGKQYYYELKKDMPSWVEENMPTYDKGKNKF